MVLVTVGTGANNAGHSCCAKPATGRMFLESPSNKKLLGALVGAPGITTSSILASSNKKLLSLKAVPGIC